MTRIVVAGSILGLVCLTAGAVHASSLAEVSAATGVHNTLAGTGTMSAKGTLDAVKRNLPSSGASCPADMLGGSGTRAAAKRSSRGSGKGWASAAKSGGRGKVGKGWATASASGTGRGSGRGGTKSSWGTSKASKSPGSGWGAGGKSSRAVAPRRR
jgi:hypothetical protein